MPTSEKVLTPREAKTVWLEREVQSLTPVLEKVADGKTYDVSKAWPLKDGQTVWSANLAFCMVNKVAMVGLCMVLCIARVLELYLNKIGSCMPRV